MGAAMDQLDLFAPENQAIGRALAHAHDEDLPPLVRDMVEVMGLPATMALVARMGGQRLRIPGLPLARASSRLQALEAIVGEPAAARFADRWGDVDVVVPRCLRAMLRERNRRICDESMRTSVDELARRYGMARRHVFRVLRGD